MTHGAHDNTGDTLAIHIRRCIVRTNIVLDDKLIREAMKLADVRTMREAVDVALRRFVHSGKQRRLLELKATGGVRKDYDYKRARSGD
jgi:Arc/MetJ family transcription regulator